MSRLFIACLCLLIAACGSPAPAPSQDGPARTAEGTVTVASFSDVDPTEWQGRPPESYGVHGVDLSRFQTSIDWQRARANGVNFAFIKATEGGDFYDPMFETHWRGAQNAGVYRGAYHFFYHCRPAIEQANWFIAHVPRSPGTLPPVLDMEWTPLSPTCTTRRDGATIRSEARVFLAALEAHYGQRPMLYTTIDFFQDTALWKLENTEFWVRSVATHPRELYAGHPWTFWQYTSTGVVPGIAGQVDINVFASSPQGWRAWLDRRLQ